MPAFTIAAGGRRVREDNDCHNPKGPGGGRFCSGIAQGVFSLAKGVELRQISPSVYRVYDNEREQFIRWKGPKGMRDVFTKHQAERIAKVWKQRKKRDVGDFYKDLTRGERFEDLLGWMNGVVGG